MCIKRQGQGSEFVVTLPRAVQVAGQAMSPPVVAHDASRSRVLIVDDNRDAAHLLAMALEVLGHDVGVAADGREALDIVAARSDWDAFILDIGMPDITGLELAVRLRRLVGDRPVRFIALTGYGQDHDLAMSREAGFDHHMTKPADVAEIHRQLAVACT